MVVFDIARSSFVLFIMMEKAGFTLMWLLIFIILIFLIAVGAFVSLEGSQVKSKKLSEFEMH